MRKLLLGLLAVGLLTVRLKPVQEADCAICGLSLAERVRRPCPRCGSMNRSISSAAEDRAAFADRTG
ncbi:MAG: hypothetical protein H0V07_04855 [Propionibacteriales bacterium]|nr:hypothetical protein [Propionibacteriales bacterium]